MVLCIYVSANGYNNLNYHIVRRYTFTYLIHFLQYFLPPFFIPASNSDTDYTSSINVNNNINQQQNYPPYEDILFHNTATTTALSTTSCNVRNVLLHVSKTLTMFTFIHIIHSVFVSFQL